jgi:hypothetical protein
MLPCQPTAMHQVGRVHATPCRTAEERGAVGAASADGAVPASAPDAASDVAAMVMMKRRSGMATPGELQ